MGLGWRLTQTGVHPITEYYGVTGMAAYMPGYRVA